MQIDETMEQLAPELLEMFDRTGPQTPTGRYLRQFWIPIAELDDVLPGRSTTLQIMNEHFTYYRGRSGTPHLVANLCAHRHTTLAPAGRIEGECIRCYYHGWMYDGDGQCVDQPAEDESFRLKVKIRAFPVREYLGFVWAYFGDGAPPEFCEFDTFKREGVFAKRSYVRRTNYFNALENSGDWVHANFVHAQSVFTDIGVNRDIPTIHATESECGISADLAYPDGHAGRNYILMPLGMYIMGTGERDDLVDHVAWRIPIDDYSHRSFIANFAELTGQDADEYRAAQRANRERLSGLPSEADIVAAVFRNEYHVDEVDSSRPDIVGIQDTVVMQPQPPMSEREPDRLGKSDAAVILLRKIYAREVAAFVSGQPIKRWSVPADLRARPQA